MRHAFFTGVVIICFSFFALSFRMNSYTLKYYLEYEPSVHVVLFCVQRDFEQKRGTRLTAEKQNGQFTLS